MKDKINFTSQIWKEGNMFVAYNPELSVSSCGKTIEEAKKNLKEAVELFIESTEKMGTLKEILQESGFIKKKVDHEKIWKAPELLSLERMSLSF
ncbi:MAG: type II toxin-antitoxin system HicB family antitoxin [Candidatus Falkowbacteria bacterium]